MYPQNWSTGVLVGDRQKYIKMSTAANWGVQKPHTPVGVQMYSCTAVRGVQENVAIERMVAVGFQEKGTQRCTIENSVKNCWADTGGI
jgi:hypothetical protein